MVLRNLSIVGKPGRWDVCIEKELIQYVVKSEHAVCDDPFVLELSNHLAFPGLINSHDHLDFNLFPPLANRKYDNYREWGSDIHQRNKREIDAVLKIPLALRTEWGLYKNLLNGITTVVNHGPLLDIESDLISVVQDSVALHSPGFEKFWRWKLNKSGNPDKPVAMHVGEGIDALSHREIESVLTWNLRRKKLVAIHGVMMNARQAKGFKALVWCPASNYFLFNRTADLSTLKSETQILFGTDSTLTGEWNLWNQLQKARQAGMLSEEELLASLTSTAASVWNLKKIGRIEKNYQADLVVTSGVKTFSEISSEHLSLIFHKGSLRLFDHSLRYKLEAAGLDLKSFHPIFLGKRLKYVMGNLPGLLKHIEHYYPASPYSSYFRQEN